MPGGAAVQVSVVMGVRDGEQLVGHTLDSVCRQEGVELECVVVDDGSTDGTADMVQARARRDPRIRLLRQAPAGLTRALINGCGESRGAYIARIDAGDRMLPGRLQRQVELMQEEPEMHVLATAIRLCGPDGEVLVDDPGPAGMVDVSAGFASGDPLRMTGCPHMSTCFRRDAYRRAGGYRAAFGLAQDVDLWSRMAQGGAVVRLEEVYTEVRVTLDGLSACHDRSQRALRVLAAEAARVRRQGGDESTVLERARRLSSAALAAGGRRGAGAYFVGSCLARRGALDEARSYLRMALRDDPSSLRVRLALARLGLRRLAAGAGLPG